MLTYLWLDQISVWSNCPGQPNVSFASLIRGSRSSRFASTSPFRRKPATREAERNNMGEAEQMMLAYEQQMTDLAKEWLGEAELNYGLAISSVQAKKKWYLMHIRQFATQLGKTILRQQRCRYDSPKHKRYATTAWELERLIENFSLDLMDL